MLTSHDVMRQWPDHQVIDTYLYYDMPLLYSSLFLDCYDCPHWVLLVCIDLDLGATEASNFTETWLAVSMSASRKAALVRNEVFLRDALTQAEDEQVFRITQVNADPPQVEALHPSQLDPQDLPCPSATLND